MSDLRFFGTDGVRGIGHFQKFLDPVEQFFANRFFGPQLCNNLAISASTIAGPGSIVIGWDRRPVNFLLAESLVSSLSKTGRPILLLGETSTPGLQFCMIENDAKLGIMITASHNPSEETGVKILFEGGRKPTLHEEEEIEGLMFIESELNGKSRVKEMTCDGYIDAIRNDLLDIVALNPSFREPLLVDGSGGWIATWLAEMMSSVGVSSEEVSDRSADINLNSGAGILSEGDKIEWDDCADSNHALLRLVKPSRRGTIIGFCFDGDGDRCLLLASYGEGAQVIGGDGFLRMIFERSHDLGKIAVAATLESNLDIFNKFRGLENSVIDETGIGDRFLQHALIAKRSSYYGVGAEPSGHVILKQKIGGKTAYYGDGVQTMIQFLKLVLHHGENWFNFATDSVYTKISHSIYPSNRSKWDPNGESGQSVISGLGSIFESDFGKYVRNSIDGADGLLYIVVDQIESWSFMIRNSGTEPKTRITIKTSCKEEDKIEFVMSKIVDILEPILLSNSS